MTPTNKDKKPRRVDSTRAKPCCGTLNYIAECRGFPKKQGLVKRQAHPEAGSCVTSYPAV